MINIPKGTKDVLPSEAYKWHYVEKIIGELTKTFGFKEIRTPMFEHTELFLRGVGDTTDIVNKEMYTFLDKGGRSISLKPEGTAGVARSFVENSLINAPQPTKMYYITPVFRYEKPQNGRLREHHQFGVELYGSESPYADAEVICLAKEFFHKLGIKNLTLYLNNIGCPVCRKKYSEELINYFSKYKDQLCPTCLERLTKNPLRILDCKEEQCKLIAQSAPKVIDFLCDDCKKHHEILCQTLDGLGVEYTINPNIVRGLDYYTRTVFEFVSEDIGSQGTVCGGGRYNGLVKEIGGPDVPAVGFGLGIERLILTMENLNLPFGEDDHPTIYVAPIGQEQYIFAGKLVYALRKKGVSAISDIMGKSIKAQMKYADKIGAKFVVAIGSDEVEKDQFILKNMNTKKCQTLSFDELVSAEWQKEKE